MAHAIKLLEMHKNLTESDKLEVANEKQVVIFMNFAESTRQAWLEKMFPGIDGNKDWVQWTLGSIFFDPLCCCSSDLDK